MTKLQRVNTFDTAAALPALLAIMDSRYIGSDTDDRLYISDLIERRTTDELRSFEGGLTSQQRELFMWVCACVLAPDVCGRIIRDTVAVRVTRELWTKSKRDLDEYGEALTARATRMEEAKRSIYRRLREKDDLITKLGNKLVQAEARAADADARRQRISLAMTEVQEEARSYQTVRATTRKLLDALNLGI